MNRARKMFAHAYTADAWRDYDNYPPERPPLLGGMVESASSAARQIRDASAFAAFSLAASFAALLSVPPAASRGCERSAHMMALTAAIGGTTSPRELLPEILCEVYERSDFSSRIALARTCRALRAQHRRTYQIYRPSERLLRSLAWKRLGYDSVMGEYRLLMYCRRDKRRARAEAPPKPLEAIVEISRSSRQLRSDVRIYLTGRDMPRDLSDSLRSLLSGPLRVVVSEWILGEPFFLSLPE